MVQANYFDGRSTRVRPVTLSMLGDDLVVAGDDLNLQVPFTQVQVDERLGSAARRLRFEDGGFVEVRDLGSLDDLLALAPYRSGHVDRLQRNVQFVLFALVACIALAFAGYKFVLPWAAARGARHLPPAIGKTLSVQTLKALDGVILMPSKIPGERRDALTAEFHALHLPEGGTPHSELLFRRSSQLGANAFTLPDGTIIVLDGLLDAIHDDHQIMAVAAHELGHAYGHHGLQLLLQTSAVGAFWTLYVGDMSQLLAAAPAALIQAHYSQDLERQADDYGATLLLHNGLSPALMADALEKLMAAHHGSSNKGYLSSHPPTDERMRHLRARAREIRS